MESVLVSSCLLGEAVRYNGGDKRCEHEILARWLREGRVVAVCPEVAGGLPVPRPPAEIVDPSGGAGVLLGKASVMDKLGQDVTTAFIKGAAEALARAGEHGIRVAVLKEGSPSCGSSYIYDGTFTGSRVPALGVTAARLTQAGIRVFSENELIEADRMLRQLDGDDIV